MKIFLPLLISLLFIISCHRTWQNPNTTLPAASISIASLISVPTVYDGAGVVVKGMVWDVVNDELVFLNDGYVETMEFSLFKLSDKNGNYVNIYTDDINEISEGDLVEVVGIYRREFLSDKRTYINEVEAKQIKVLKSLKKKYSSNSDSNN
ncbi:MAG: hypothetical protein ACR2NC_04630 [Thermodesulfobacteriota bacterium]